MDTEALMQNKFENFLEFKGKGSTYFGIVILNMILSMITLGIYYPWAKATRRKYLWNELNLNDSPFIFNGTGKEMFRGFVFIYILFIMLFGLAALSAKYGWTMYLAIIIYIFFIAIMPLVVYGAWRYQMSRTSWRGIYFSFEGDVKEFSKLYLINLFLTIITFGIYGSWMFVNVFKYLCNHTQFGTLKFDFHGNGTDFFVLNLVGGVLSSITLFLYSPIWLKNRYNYVIDNISVSEGDQQYMLKSDLQNQEAWTTMVTNTLLLLFTLFIAFPWTFMRTLRMFFNNIVLPEEIDFDSLEQGPISQQDATADSLLDVFDMGFDI